MPISAFVKKEILLKINVPPPAELYRKVTIDESVHVNRAVYN